MSKDEPDYTKAVKIYAWNGTTLVPVLVDTEGRIVMIPYGTLDVIGEVDVNQTDKAREIQGKDGVTLRTIAVDSSGNIVAVIKGEYGGILKTVAIDDKGYMLIKQLPLLTFDRKGDIVLYDDFEDGLNKCKFAGSGTGAACAINMAHVKRGSVSVKLTGGSTANYWGRLSHYTPYLTLSKWGYEISFLLGELYDYALFSLECSTGSVWKIGRIKIDFTNFKLQYYNNVADYVDIATGFKLYPGDKLFHTIKLVCDMENDKYVKVIIDNNQYDLSGIALSTGSTSTEPMALVRTFLYSESGYNGYIYLDDCILTQNEP